MAPPAAKRAGPLAEESSKRQRTSQAPNVVVGWFRNDLRVSDNPMLEEVARRAQEQNLPTALVYILDPRFYDRSDYGRITNQALPGKSALLRGDHFASRKCNGRRARFYLNVLRDLQRCLELLGTQLWIFYGKPEDVFADLSMQYGALDVVCLREPVSPEWTDVEKYTVKSLQLNGGSLTRIWGAMSLYHEEDTPFAFKESPNSYTGLAKEFGWKDVWTTLDQFWWAAPIREPIPAPTTWSAPALAQPKGAWSQKLIDSDRDYLQSLGFTLDEIDETLRVPHGGSRKGKGGETAAWLRFNAWMLTDPVAETYNPKFVALGGEYGAAGAKFIKEGEIDAFQWKNLSTSAGWLALSKYMACGCITAREMYHTLLRKNHWALPGVVHRFMWREWHRINAIKYKTHLFRLQGPGGQNHFPRWGNSVSARRWKDAQTGVPYIDACMRELNQTGWLPYHKRKTVACFLCHDLSVDWRFGGFHFEEVLLDYDVAMNYGNWVFCARVDKPYSSPYTASAYRDNEHWCVWKSMQASASNDPNGDYIRQWLPELKNVPKEWIYHPWMMKNEEMAEANCVIGKDYPEPLVQFPQLQITDLSQKLKRNPLESLWEVLSKVPGMRTAEMALKFPFVSFCFLFIVYLSGNIDNPNCICKQLLIVCSHNMAIGYLFDRAPEGIYIGFPHFGPLSVDIPVLRMLARFWSYEMIAVRWATALRPLFLPGLFASWMSLIIPQSAVFASAFLAIMSSDYFKNPISFASVNGMPALIWLFWFLYRNMKWDRTDLIKLWVDVENFQEDWIAVALFVLPFLGVAMYTIIAKFATTRLTMPAKFPANGKTFFFLHTAIFLPIFFYLMSKGWKLEDVHKIGYGYASLIPIWWVNFLGGVDLWIEEPLGMPARFIAFTPTWIVTHGVYFIQWALDPSDYINRVIFVFYFLPQMIYLNFYFRKACKQDWGTQLPIYYSYFMFAHMVLMELYKLWVDIQAVGIASIYATVTKDSPFHFSPLQMTTLVIVCTLEIFAPNARFRWAVYSSCGPLNWLGIL